jgi:dolichyl-phosphate-mannose-protein mannosyltransferase
VSKRRAIIWVSVILAFSAAVRVVSLDAWPAYVFDEHYYAHDAAALLKQGLASDGWRSGGLRTQSQPLLGDATIAAGIAVFGDDPWGWRLPSALAGVALIAMVYPLARRLLLNRLWAVCATGLAACDTLLMTQSRLAMLDTFVALWTAVCVYCALRAARAPRPAVWLWLCGAAGGLAVASKWSGLFAIVAALAVLCVWRRPGGTSLWWSVLACTLLPAAVYLVSYAPYFAAGHSVGQWIELQRYMAAHGWTLSQADARASAPARWFSDVDTIWYRWSVGANGVRGLLAIGNPLLWWGAIVALVALGVAAVRRRSRLLGLPVLLVACLYVPWLATGRTTFLYYMVPIVPFLALALARALSLVRFRLATGYVLLTAVPGVLWLPFVLSFSVPWAYYHTVMLLPAWR